MNGKGKGRALVGNNKIAFDVAWKEKLHKVISYFAVFARACTLVVTNKPENYGQTEKKIIDTCYVAHRASTEKKINEAKYLLLSMLRRRFS